MKCYLKFLIVGFCLFCGVASALAQTAPGKYWIRFADKANSVYSLSRPEEFLSSKCVERRIAQGIGFDELDLPVNQEYIDAVLSMGPGILHHRSKWFNAITVITEDSTWLNEVRLLPFVAEVRAAEANVQSEFNPKFFQEENQTRSSADEQPCKFISGIWNGMEADRNAQRAMASQPRISG